MYKTINFKHDKVIIIGGGESLKGFDFSRLNNFTGVIIAVNRVIDHIQRADYWITIDTAWNWPGQLNKMPHCYYFAGVPAEKFEQYKHVSAHLLLRVQYFTENKNEITGGNSAYAALNLAYHFGAKQILLLGVDACGLGHWHPDGGLLFNDCPKANAQIENLPSLFERCVEKFQETSATVINGSSISKISCFPKLNIDDALSWLGVKS